jgi:hypothetical protein
MGIDKNENVVENVCKTREKGEIWIEVYIHRNVKRYE